MLFLQENSVNNEFESNNPKSNVSKSLYSINFINLKIGPQVSSLIFEVSIEERAEGNEKHETKMMRD